MGKGACRGRMYGGFCVPRDFLDACAGAQGSPANLVDRFLVTLTTNMLVARAGRTRFRSLGHDRHRQDSHR